MMDEALPNTGLVLTPGLLTAPAAHCHVMPLDSHARPGLRPRRLLVRIGLDDGGEMAALDRSSRIARYRVDENGRALKVTYRVRATGRRPDPLKVRPRLLNLFRRTTPQEGASVAYS